MVKDTSQMYITGPQVIKEVTGQDINGESLGGALVNAQISGNIHFVAQNDEDAINILNKLLYFLPSNNTEDAYLNSSQELTWTEDNFLNTIIPDSSKESYDMYSIIKHISDNRDFLEVKAEFAKNIIVGFSKINGITIGIVANNPEFKAGVLDIDASDKSAEFIRFCNVFNIPVVTLVDVPGFMPGIEQEYGGIIRHGAKMLFAYAASTIPKITIVIRKAYGGAYLAMSAKSMGTDRVAAWPTAEIAVMGAEGAANIIFRKEILSSKNPDETKKDKIEEYREEFSNPYIAASRGLIDSIIEPKDTRKYIALSLEMLKSKSDIRPPKKHGLIPM
jgi:methylmalonyl-CoA carboxyltransferase large subunit